MSGPELVLVVPCFDEAARLAPQAFLEFAATHTNARLLFVDDGSTDGTGEILERLRASDEARISVLRLSSHAGKAEAVRAGILEAFTRRPTLVGFWDADLSTPLSAVDAFLTLARARPDLDVLLGSRVNLMGRDVRRPMWRHYLGRVFATAVSHALALPVYDTQCGAKIFRVTSAIETVFATPFRTRWIFDVELISRYLSTPVAPGDPPRRARIYEVAVPAWHHRSGSKLNALDFPRALVDLIGIWLRR